MELQLKRRRDHGFTLVELLIAAGLAAIVLMMGYLVFVGSDRSFRSGQAAINAGADLRHAMDVVVQDVRHAAEVATGSTAGEYVFRMPTSVASTDITYIYDDSENRLVRQGGGADQKLIVDSIAEFTVAPTDGITTVRLVSTRENYELTSKVSLRNNF